PRGDCGHPPSNQRPSRLAARVSLVAGTDVELTMSAVLGISGAKRNACAAICVDGEITAACEQERLTRVRGVGLAVGALPAAAVEQVIASADQRTEQVAGYAVAEPEVRLPASVPTIVVDHHQAHAATAFLTSPFARAAIIVCDTHADRELTVWVG